MPHAKGADVDEEQKRASNDDEGSDEVEAHQKRNPTAIDEVDDEDTSEEADFELHQKRGLT
jgi:hypothetical protein